MKVFISQPMNGRSKEEILQEREKMKQVVMVLKDTLQKRANCENDDTIEFLDTYFTEDEPSNIKRSGVYWLGKSIEKLAEADIAIFVTRCYNYRGCSAENNICELYKIPIYYMDI